MAKTDEELADLQLEFEELRDKPAWRILRAKVDELSEKFERETGREALRASRHDVQNEDLMNDMLKQNLRVAYRRGTLDGMRMVVEYPEKISAEFNKAFKEKLDG